MQTILEVAIPINFKMHAIILCTIDMHYYRIGGDPFRSVVQEDNPMCITGTLK